ncbi:MAG: response regulator [Planctomycetaceae bacterium]|nr:response regulator [Planctomycetaceae bacterium]
MRTAAAIIVLFLVSIVALFEDSLLAEGLRSSCIDRLSSSISEAAKLELSAGVYDQIFFCVIICLFVMLLLVFFLYHRSQKQRLVLEQQVELSQTTSELNRVAAEKQRLFDEFSRELSFCRQVLNAVPLGLYWKDENGQIKGQNPAFGALLEQANDPRACFEQFADNKLDREVLTKGIDLMHVPQVLKLGAREKKMLVSRIPLRGLNGRITGMLNCQIPGEGLCSGAVCDFLNHTCAMDQWSLPVMLMDPDLTARYVNAALARWIGKPNQQFESAAAADLLNAETSDLTECLKKADLNGTKTSLPIGGKQVDTFIQKLACSGAAVLFVFFAEPGSSASGRPSELQSAQPPEPLEKSLPEILIVDDVEENRTLLDILLRKNNYAPVRCSSGQEAIETCGQKRFDLILMDIQMPEMDGFEAMRQIRAGALNGSTPMIAMTASEKREDELAALEFGFDDYLSKPINSKQMERKIWRSLQKTKQIQEAQSGKEIVSFLDGNPDYRKAIETFVQNLPVRLEEMKQAFEKRDLRDLAFKVHALKGVGGFAGFSVYTEKAKTVEEAIKEDQLDVVAKQLDEMVNMCLRTRLKTDCS